jgi:hypothetical protein
VYCDAGRRIVNAIKNRQNPSINALLEAQAR